MDAASLPENGRAGTASRDEVRCTRLWRGKIFLYTTVVAENACIF